MAVFGSRVLTIFVISILVASSPLIIVSDELNPSKKSSSVNGRVTVDYLVESVTFGNSSYPVENWTQPDKSVASFLIRGVEVEIDITILQNAGSLGQFSTAYVLIEAYHPIGYLEWSDSYTETMTRGMRNTSSVKWTPESAHSELDNGVLVGGYEIKVSISTDLIDTDADESNNIMEMKMPVAIWRDTLDDENDFSDYFSMRAYQYSKNTADGPGSVGKGAWQFEEGTGIGGSASYRHSTPGNNYPGNAYDRLVWGFATDGQSGCGEVLGVRSSNEDPWDGDGSYFWPWCRAKLDGSQFVSLDISTNAWGVLGSGDKVGLELWKAGGGNVQTLVKEITGVSSSESQWSKVNWRVSDEEMNKLEWHLGFIFESDNSIATSGYHVDDFVIFAIENVSRFTLDVDCVEYGSSEYPDLGFSVIPDDPDPPGMECFVQNNGYRDAQVSVISENNNDTWFDPRIDHSLSQTYGSQVFVIIPPDQTATFWINQSIIPAAEVTNPSDITLLNISIIGSFTLEEHYFTSIPVSVGYHDNARIWSDASNPAFTLFPGQSSSVDLQVTNTGNKNGKFQLTGAFPNDRPQWLPWLSLSYKDQFGNDLPKDNNGFQSVELNKGQSIDLTLDLLAPIETFPGIFDLELQVNGIEGTSTQAIFPLSVEVRTKFDLQMSTEIQNLSSPADGVQELIPIFLVNNGNTEETFNLEILGDRFLLGATFSNQLSSYQTPPLAAYGLDTSGVNLILPMNEGIIPGDYTLIVTATSVKDQTFKSELYFVITVEGTRKVEVESRDLSEQSYRGGQPDESINVQINNTGNVEDQFNVELDIPVGMYAYVDSIGMDDFKTPLIQPGSSFNVTISFTFDTLAEGNFDLGITARSSFNENVKSTGNIIFIVGSVGRLELLLNSDDLDVDLDAEEAGKSYILTVNDDGDYSLNLQIFNRYYLDQGVRIDFDDQVSSSYFRIKIDEYTTAFNIKENDNDEVALKITIPRSTLLSLPSDTYLVNLTIWVESDYDIVPLVLRVELMRESLNDENLEETSADLSKTILNGLSVVLLIGILMALLFVFWREFSKEDEEEINNMYIGSGNNLNSETGVIPSTGQVLGGYQVSEKVAPELPQNNFDSDVSTTPALPLTGLPEGWTMEQWKHYGQQWLDQQK
ncbi:MAG: hypothetical protein CMB64_03605 [Euryarchaeota archaeon]|nr:hypothetical protein [Euryarchaeota archaeon]